MIRREAKALPLTLEEIQTFASDWCPDCYQDFQITMEGEVVCFRVKEWTCRKTISDLCTLQIDGRMIPQRLAMELNVSNLFDNMQEIWEQDRKGLI